MRACSSDGYLHVVHYSERGEARGAGGGGRRALDQTLDVCRRANAGPGRAAPHTPLLQFAEQTPRLARPPRAGALALGAPSQHLINNTYYMLLA